MDQHDRAFYESMSKEAADTAVETNDSSTEGTNPVEPPAAAPPSEQGSMDAPWGENDVKGQKNDPVHLSDVVATEIMESRQKLLDRCFAQKGPAQRAEQAFMGQHLDHAASGQFESRAPLLEGKAKLAAPETLTDQTRRLFDDD